jgi:ribosomal protein S18 acetylase RimI-like enzyme
VDNPDAQLFYRELGFVATGRIPGFYMGTLDALTMEMPLRLRGPQLPDEGAAG